MKGHSGKVGNLVITREGHMRSRPDTSKRVWSPAQLAHLGKWDQAKAYGRMVIRDQVLNSYYGQKALKLKGKGAWHLAIEDYFQHPDLYAVNFNDYNGRKGDCLKISEVNKYKLKEIMVTITNVMGEIIEKGFAFESEKRESWTYPIQQDYHPAPGTIIVVKAVSLPGHVEEKQIVIADTLPMEFLFSQDTNQQSNKKRRMKSQLRTD